MRYGIFACAALAACVVSSAAWADKKFGGVGTLVISDDQPINLSSTGGFPITAGSQSTVGFEYGAVSGSGTGGGATGGTSNIAFGLAPAADLFVVENLSVGGQVLFDYYSFGGASSSGGGPGSVTTTTTSTNVTVLGIAPRIGYNIRLTDSISFWPKLYVSYATASASSSAPNSGSSGFNSFTLGLYAPFLYHPVEHVFLGLGPNFLTQLSSNATSSFMGMSTSAPNGKLTEVGLQATIGGWFLGN